jgi:hypothetical protein
MTENTDEFDTREKIVQTTQGFQLSIMHQRGTGVRDQDEISVTWDLEHRPTNADIRDLSKTVEREMEVLRDANRPSEDEE